MDVDVADDDPVGFRGSMNRIETEAVDATLPGSLGRRVFTGAAWISVAGAAAKLFSIATAPILTALIAPAEYGFVAVVAAAASLAASIALFGLDASYARCWAGKEDDVAQAVERLCWWLAIALSTVFAAATTGLWLTTTWVRAGAAPGFAAFFALYVPLSAAMTMSQTRARFRRAYGRLAASVLASAATGALSSIALALWWRDDAWALLVGSVLGMAAGIAIAGIPRSIFVSNRSIIARAEYATIFEIGVSAMTNATTFWLINSADRWFIGLYRDPAELGIYSFAGAIGGIGLTVNAAITATWVPEITTAYERGGSVSHSAFGREWARLVGVLLIVWLAVSSAGGDLLRLLAHSSFHDGARYVPWIATGVFFYGVASISNTGLWLAKAMRPSAYWWVIGAGASVGLNAIVVPVFGAVGAAISGCVCYLLIGCGTMWSANKRVRLNVPWKSLAGAFAIVAVVGAAMISPWNESPLTSVILKCPVGFIAALVVFRITARDWALGFLSGIANAISIHRTGR